MPLASAQLRQVKDAVLPLQVLNRETSQSEGDARFGRGSRLREGR